MPDINNLEGLLKKLGLKAMAQQYLSYADGCEKSGQTYLEYLTQLVSLELEDRDQRRIQRLTKQAHLPCLKTIEEFKLQRVKGLSPSILEVLRGGQFIDQCENLLLFGNPGTGKTHLCIGLAQAWCQRGRKVLYTSAASLVQRLLRAKRDLELDQLIKQFDRLDMLIIDDISYVPYERQETDVLFTLLSERYERRSMMITSNTKFSDWESIFKDKMTTAAAIDRLVHHSTILELNAPSYRTEIAKKKKSKRKKTTQKKPTKKEAK
ncbi:MAG: IS21-like element helper ATPase IstB [Pseudomonadales bacterium]|nr:IS21-like element helper ATPase IstB [Pseudomonadales bacterium]